MADLGNDPDFKDLYIRDWVKTMILIWREKIERLRIMDTGRLHQSLDDQILEYGNGSLINFTFVRYGIYQSLGVGNGYTHGNGGYLEILDPEYRREHKLGKPRQRRDWIYKKLMMSRYNLIADLSRITGQQAVSVICDALDDMRIAAR